MLCIFPGASASRYDDTSNSLTLHSIYNKSIYVKVRETRLPITFHNMNFAEFQEKIINETFSNTVY
ncbi:hypothetical protein HCG69_00825 [Bacteroides sp. K03]|nr:hypothetical protein [Bacteroides sp. K03]